MNEFADKPSLKKLGHRGRRAVTVSGEDLVRSSRLDGCRSLPAVFSPASEGVELRSWAASHRDRVQATLREAGGVLFRGFAVADVAEFESVVDTLTGGLLEYKERSSPRRAIADRVYTSTDYPPEHPIFLHNENSYQRAWPMRIFFYCDVAPSEGGATPLADTRGVFRRIDPEVRDRFVEQGWRYVRNFGAGFGLDWRTVFQTKDPAEVEAYCRTAGISAEWCDDGTLRASAVRPAAVRHPETGEMVWFNHATFFHVSTLPQQVRESLLAGLGEGGLPTNTYYGDGSPIEPEVMDHLRAAYEAETVRFPWRQGDLLMLDNMLTAHGREPFSGARRILVGMADPCSWEDLVA